MGIYINFVVLCFELLPVILIVVCVVKRVGKNVLRLGSGIVMGNFSARTN